MTKVWSTLHTAAPITWSLSRLLKPPSWGIIRVERALQMTSVPGRHAEPRFTNHVRVERQPERSGGASYWRRLCTPPTRSSGRRTIAEVSTGRAGRASGCRQSCKTFVEGYADRPALGHARENWCWTRELGRTTTRLLPGPRDESLWRPVDAGSAPPAATCAVDERFSVNPASTLWQTVGCCQPRLS